ncbi:MAG TPA: hypothetical protein VLX56_00130 [Nitrososphaerales archaeon]|nr:hypothetical protein [Nitrososphaerales archaeon]
MASGPPQDPDIANLAVLTSDLVKAGLLAPEHQQKMIQTATEAAGKIDDLRKFLNDHISRSRLLGSAKAQLPAARQQVIDSVSSTILSVNKIQSVLSLLSDAGLEAAQKVISFILGRLMAVLDDFRNHVQYQNWSVSFTGGVPFALQVGVAITFQ